MAKKILNLDTVTGAKSWGSVDADNVVLDTTNFDKNLDTTVTDVQKLADAVDELELGGLPIPTNNALLRGNGAEWVTTVNSTLSDGNTDVEFRMYNNSLPTKKFISIKNTGEYSELFVQANKTSEALYSRYCGMVSNEYTSQVMANTANNEFVRMYSTNTDKYVQLKPNGGSNNQQINIQTTKTYSATSKIFEFIDKFEIYQNGKIVSNYLSGSTNQLLEVAPDGTIQRYTGTIPSAQVNSDWNATSGVAEILNKPNIPTNIPTKIEHLSTSLIGTEYTVSRETLGITGDLRDRIKQMKVWIKNASGGDLRTDSTAGEYIGTDFISVDFNTDLSGNYVKIVLYIE